MRLSISHEARACDHFLVFLARPHFVNVSKRLIKAPKLYFCDSGLAAWLIGIRTADHLRSHPLRGHLFENWVMRMKSGAFPRANEDPSGPSELMGFGIELRHSWDRFGARCHSNCYTNACPI